MPVIDCHPMVEWPAGGPELSDLGIEIYRAEAWIIASHPAPDREALEIRDRIIGSCVKFSNRYLKVLQVTVPILREGIGKEEDLERAIKCQAKRWHLLLIKNVLEGLRGEAAHPWAWDPDAERNLDVL